MLARGAVKLHSPEQKKWLIVAACHAGMPEDNRTPVGSVRVLSARFLEGFISRSRIRTIGSTHDPIAASSPVLATWNIRSRFGKSEAQFSKQVQIVLATSYICSRKVIK